MSNLLNSCSIWPWLDPIPDFLDNPPASGVWPKISIVTPNFNYGHLIEATIRSVLVQAYPNLEYIIIDDGSVDDSTTIIKKYEAKLGYFEHQKNQGQYPTINKGFSKASGEIFGWLNSDDIYLPWTLRAVAAVFNQFPAVDWIVGCPAFMQDGVIRHVDPLRPYPREMIRAGLYYNGMGGFRYIQQESCFWRRRLWKKAGGLRDSLGYAADFELWTRFALYADLYSVATLLGGFMDRGKANRSIANANRYEAEVKKVIADLRADPKSAEAKLARQLAVFSRFSGTWGIRGIARRLFSVPCLKGPVLKWNYIKSCYELVTEKFL